MKDIDVYVNILFVWWHQRNPKEEKKMLQYISVEYKESKIMYKSYSKSLATLHQIRGPN